MTSPTLPCPDCDAPLKAPGRHCKVCGYDADLEEALAEDAIVGESAAPPGEPESFDYDRFLEQEGLGRTSTARIVSISLGAAIVLIALLLAALR